MYSRKSIVPRMESWGTLALTRYSWGEPLKGIYYWENKAKYLTRNSVGLTFGSCHKSFTMISSLSEMYFRFRRFILLVKKKKVISMNNDSSTSSCCHCSYKSHAYSQIIRFVTYLFYKIGYLTNTKTLSWENKKKVFVQMRLDYLFIWLDYSLLFIWWRCHYDIKINIFISYYNLNN